MRRKNDFLHDFRSGETANFLRKKLGISIATNDANEYKLIEGVNIQRGNKFVEREGKIIYKEGEDEYLMFAYKKHYHVQTYSSFPKYHITNCETRRQYSNFQYSNRMPVTIHCRDTGQIHKNQYLSLCKNCNNEIFSSWIFPVFGTHEWYDAVLRYAENQTNPITRTDGYVAMWSQISSAYREKHHWKCEKCHIDLKGGRKYLHVHHVDGNKLNNTEKNFRALCVLCHAFEHEYQLQSGDGFLGLSDFFEDFGDQIKSTNSELFRRGKIYSEKRLSNHYII